jgi:peptide/nickel transport system permease protein
MWYLVLKRLGAGLLMLLAVSVIVFVGTELLPGDIAEILLGQSATPETLAALRSELGLDQPAHIRYLMWLGDMARGDLGMSFARNAPVAELVASRIGNTFILAGCVAVIVVPVAIFAGLLAAMYPGGVADRVISWLTLGSISFPEFFTATVLVLLFSIQLGWLPPISTLRAGSDLGDWAAALALPVATLSVSLFGQMVRLTRATTLNIMSEAYVEMAVLKGLSRRRIVFRHVGLNAIGPVVNIVALNLAYLVGGVVIVETIFAFPGLAKLMIDGVQTRDLPVVQICAMIFCVTYVVLILVADVAAIFANPRLRHPK